jgi:hypothetical protein
VEGADFPIGNYCPLVNRSSTNKSKAARATDPRLDEAGIDGMLHSPVKFISAHFCGSCTTKVSDRYGGVYSNALQKPSIRTAFEMGSSLVGVFRTLNQRRTQLCC